MESKAGPVEHALTDDDPPFEFRLHRNALLELAAFLIAAAAIDTWLLQPGTLASLKPHPFWIPIILISLQYGTIDGLVAVAACTMTLWLLDWPKPDTNEEYFIYLSRTLNEPTLWLGSAILIGEFRLRQISAARRLSASRDRIDKERKLLAAHLTETYGRVEHLELQLAGTRPDSSAELLEALSMLHRGEPHDAYFNRAIEVCAQIALGADSLSLYELVDGALVATLRIGPDAIPVRRSRFGPEYSCTTGSSGTATCSATCVPAIAAPWMGRACWLHRSARPVPERRSGCSRSSGWSRRRWPRWRNDTWSRCANILLLFSTDRTNRGQPLLPSTALSRLCRLKSVDETVLPAPCTACGGCTHLFRSAAVPDCNSGIRALRSVGIRNPHGTRCCGRGPLLLPARTPPIEGRWYRSDDRTGSHRLHRADRRDRLRGRCLVAGLGQPVPLCASPVAAPRCRRRHG